MAKTIGTALLSYGMSGRVFHAPFIHIHPGFQLLGSWERSKKQIASDYPGVKSYPSLEAVLADPAVELVVVNTPTYTHFEYAKAVIQAGKHAVVEKAFTGNAQEAIELKDLALKHKVNVSVFQNRRWDSDFLTVKRVVESGVLGDVIEASFAYDRFNPSLSYKIHKETPSDGAGIVKDLGPHLIDQSVYLFGMPQAVFADLMITREESQVDDYFEILLYYPSFRVRLHSGYFVKEPVPSFVVHGRKGSFQKTRADVQEAKLQAGMKPSPEGWEEPESEQGLLHAEKDGVTTRQRIPTDKGSYYNYYDGVYRSLSENIAMPVTIEDGIGVMKIIDAVYQSSKTGVIVRI